MKSHCNSCGGDRNHTVLHSHQDEIPGPTYSLIRCAGCGDISVRLAERIGDAAALRTTFYPPRQLRCAPPWLSDSRYNTHLPATLRALLREIYVVLQVECLMSAAMCVRAAIETVMVERVGDNRSFAENLRRFVLDGYVSPKQRDALGPIIEAGSATIHRAFSPTVEQVLLLIEVLEALVHTIYIQPIKSATLRIAVPTRPSR